MATDSHLPPGGRSEPAGRPGGIFYGWYVVLGGMLATAINSGVYFYGMSVFITPLIREFGWSRATLSGAFSLSRLEAGLAGPVAGMCIDRWGPRRTMLLGVTIMGAGFLLFSQVQSVTAFYIIFILFLSAGASFGIGPSVMTAVANWFVRKRGLAMGVVMAGVGIGGLITSGIGSAIVAFGWRETAAVIGLGVWLFGLPLALLMRHRPEQYGLVPDGGAMVGRVVRAEAQPNLAPRAVLRTRSFWLLAVIFGLRNMTTGGVIVHLPALLVDRGYSLDLAAATVGILTLVSVPGRLLCGWLGDIVEKRYIFAIALVFLAVGILALSAGSATWLLVIFVLTFGTTYGGTVPLVSAIIADYFGRKHFGTVYGCSQFAQMWGNILGPLVAGYCFDLLGTYRPVLIGFAVANLAALALTLVVRPPVRPEARSRPAAP